MTVTVDLESTRSSVVLGGTFATILSGRCAVSGGTEAIATVTCVATPGATVEVRTRSLNGNDFSLAQTVATAETVRLGPITVDEVSGDTFQVQARTVAGQGGLVLIDWAGLQGTLADQPPDGGGGTETQITVHPQSYALAPGGNHTFTVSAVGDNLTYTWEESTDGGTNWSPVGTDQPSYTVTNVQSGDNGNEYRVTVSGDNNPVGGPVVSNIAVLTVNVTTASITVEPSDQQVVEGTTATFTVLGNNIDSWTLYRRTGGTGNGSSIDTGSGWQSNTVQHTTPLTLLSDDGAEYRWALRGTDLVDVYTRWALLTVTPASTAQLLMTDTEVN